MGEGEKQEKRRMAPSQKERKWKRVNITAMCQANMGCWDPSTKSKYSYSREKKLRQRVWETETRREKVGTVKGK